MSGLFCPLFPFLSWANSDSLLHISQYGNHANSFVQVSCLLISNFYDKIIINIPTCTNELRPSQPPLNLISQERTEDPTWLPPSGGCGNE